VRGGAGLFDVSHMGRVAFRGEGAAEFLQGLVTNDLSAVRPGHAQYNLICNPEGGVLDDLVVYRQGEQEYLVIANASNTAVVLSELRSRASGFDAVVADATDDYALIAVQGPAAAGILSSLTDLDLGAMKYYAGAFGSVAGCPCWVARTGYTGEDGFEVYCRPPDAVAVWEAVSASGTPEGLVPAGLAARDTLRLEAGMPLYGNELGPDMTPFEAGLGRVVKFDKPGDFVGRSALLVAASASPPRRLVGLTIESRRVARHGYPVLVDGVACGVVTSGAPSPTLGHPIAMAYLNASADARDAVLTVGIRGENVPAQLTDLPFYSRSR